MLQKIKNITAVEIISKKEQQQISGGREPQCTEDNAMFNCGCSSCWYCHNNRCVREEQCECIGF